ncbi:MAG: hypothetical protein WC128_05305 [Bacteroidales bacterium]|jgi:hypothetical protein
MPIAATKKESGAFMFAEAPDAFLCQQHGSGKSQVPPQKRP